MPQPPPRRRCPVQPAAVVLLEHLETGQRGLRAEQRRLVLRVEPRSPAQDGGAGLRAPDRLVGGGLGLFGALDLGLARFSCCSPSAPHEERRGARPSPARLPLVHLDFIGPRGYRAAWLRRRTSHRVCRPALRPRCSAPARRRRRRPRPASRENARVGDLAGVTGQRCAPLGQVGRGVDAEDLGLRCPERVAVVHGPVRGRRNLVLGDPRGAAQLHHLAHEVAVHRRLVEARAREAIGAAAWTTWCTVTWSGARTSPCQS